MKWISLLLVLLVACTHSEDDGGLPEGEPALASVEDAGNDKRQVPELVPEEYELAALVRTRADADRELLSELVQINSGSLNIEGVRRVGARVARELESVGFSSTWIRPELDAPRAGHLIATHTSTSGSAPSILLIVHLDTVFETTDTPLRVEGDKAFGPGVHDMKGGIVVMLSALHALHESGQLDQMNLTVVAIGDEELPSTPLEKDREIIRELSKTHQFALAFEGFNDDHPGIVTGRRGISFWELSTTSEGGHSSRIGSDDLGAGAAYETARVLGMFQGLIEDGLTVNAGLIGSASSVEVQPGKLIASGKVNRIPEMAYVKGDIRYLTNSQRDTAKDSMEQIVRSSLPGTSSQIVFTDLYPPMEATYANDMLRGTLEDVSLALLGEPLPAVDPIHRGASDACFVGWQTPTIDGLGPSGGGDHTKDEYVSLSSMTDASARLAILLLRLNAS